MALHLHDSPLLHRGLLIKLGGRSPDRYGGRTKGSKEIESNLSGVMGEAS